MKLINIKKQFEDLLINISDTIEKIMLTVYNNRKSIFLLILSFSFFPTWGNDISDASRPTENIQVIKNHVLATKTFSDSTSISTTNAMMHSSSLIENKIQGFHINLKHVIQHYDYNVLPYNDTTSHGLTILRAQPYVDTFNMGNSPQDYFIVYSLALPGTLAQGASGLGYNNESIITLDAGFIKTHPGSKWIGLHEKGHEEGISHEGQNISIEKTHIPSSNVSIETGATLMSVGSVPFRRIGATVNLATNAYTVANGGTGSYNFTIPLLPSFSYEINATEFTPNISGLGVLDKMKQGIDAKGRIHNISTTQTSSPIISYSTSGDIFVQNTGAYNDSITVVEGTNLGIPKKYTVHAIDTSNTNISLGSFLVGDTAELSDFNLPAGLNYISFVVYELYGNSTSAYGVVESSDTTGVVVNILPATAYLNTSGNISVLSSLLDNVSYDNESGISLVYPAQFDFSCSEIGTHNVDINYINGAGDTATGTTQITILDTLPAFNLSANNISRDFNGTTPVTVNVNEVDINFTASDNCPSSLTYTIDAGNSATFNTAGVHTVTYTAMSNGYPTSISGTVTLSDTSSTADTTPPITTAQTINLTTDSLGNVVAAPSDLSIQPTDPESGIGSINITDPNGNCQVDGGQYLTTFTATNTDGFTSSPTDLTINLLDNLSPEVELKDSIVLSNPEGVWPYDLDNANITTQSIFDELALTAYDNCGIENIVMSTRTLDIGENEIQFTVKDTENNTTIVTAKVVVDGPTFVSFLTEHPNFKVYPNPTTGIVKFVGLVKGAEGFKNVIVTDLLGKVVSIEDFDKEAQKLDMSSLTPGSYFLTAFDEKNTPAFRTKIAIE